MKTSIENLIKDAVSRLSLGAAPCALEYPSDPAHGDHATNVALILAKKAGMNPRALAESIVAEIKKQRSEYIEKIEIAGPGFINFFLSPKYFSDKIALILKEGRKFGKGSSLKRQRILVEYTDPNPFKQFHIGHLMSNSIGESLSRLIESQGAKIVRICYQGDVGLHVAKALWAIAKNRDKMPSSKAPLSDRTAFLGMCYVEGATAYENDAQAKGEIDALNKKVFEGKDRDLMKLYALGKKWSLEHFEAIYDELGTRFDRFIFESSVADDGIKIVNEFLKAGVFETSDGAIVFKGEKHDPKLHTRVFINSQGLPTYETKEIGLNTFKWKKWHPDRSVIVTANEQSDYFRVVLKALELVAPDARKATEHVSHGMLRFAEGKMSSRKGNVITGESLLDQMEEMAREKMRDNDLSEKDRKKIAQMIGVAAIKYSILRQSIGSDIIYDFERSISFEGDSGPYLLYTAVRAQSVLEKAKKEGVKPKTSPLHAAGVLERLLIRFPDIVKRAVDEKAPHLVASYLTHVCSEFNAWYARTPIVVKGDASSSGRVATTAATRVILENGLNLLGVRIPEAM